MGWHDLSTLEEPYRIEGKKTMGLELAEQLGWSLPDVIYYPTGGGTGFIGMWKAFDELEAIGWIGSQRPRMVAVQSTGCGPIVRAYQDGRNDVEAPWDPVETQIHGVRVPKPPRRSLDLKESSTKVRDSPLASPTKTWPRRGPKLPWKRGCICVPKVPSVMQPTRPIWSRRQVNPEDRVVIFNTASGLKSPMPPMERRLDCTKPIDYAAL